MKKRKEEREEEEKENREREGKDEEGIGKGGKKNHSGFFCFVFFPQ